MHVFLIESPLQLMNGLEAKAKFGFDHKDCHLLILNGENPNTVKQIIKMVDPSEWKTVKQIGFGRGKLSWVMRMVRLKAQYKNYKHVDTVVIGDYRADVMRDFVTVVNPQKTILLDDGTVSLRVYRSLSSEAERSAFFKQEQNGKLKQLFKKMAYFGRVPTQQHIDDLVFFTVYDLVSNQYIKVVKNNYSHLKRVNAAKNKKSEVWFLGSPLAEKAIVPDRETYIHQLEKIKAHYDGFKEIFYIPHRAEEQENLEVYNNMGFTLLHTDVSIEFYLASQDEIPTVIASFYSSALGNIHNIFGSEMDIDAFEIEQNYLPENNKREINDIYRYYEKIINVIKL